MNNLLVNDIVHTMLNQFCSCKSTNMAPGMIASVLSDVADY